MFHVIKLEKIDFQSNPPLVPRHVVSMTTREDGSPVNKFVLTERDNKSPLSGAHYDPSIMSLRARLARGVELQSVSYDVTNNDLNSLYNSSKKLALSLRSKIELESSPVNENSQSDNSNS